MSRQDTGSTAPKLVPSDTGFCTVTVSSEGVKGKKNKRPCRHPDWQTLTMGGTTDDHASTSSLVDANEQEGVMMQRDVIVSVEDKKFPETVFDRDSR
jgi:hypothetical protein